MKELKLLYSYEEWKDKKGNFEEIQENTAKCMALAFNFNRTEEEEKEYQELRDLVDYEQKLSEYTKLVHEITDMYNKLKYIHYDDERTDMYERIGRKQCEIEIIKEDFLK